MKKIISDLVTKVISWLLVLVKWVQDLLVTGKDHPRLNTTITVIIAAIATCIGLQQCSISTTQNDIAKTQNDIAKTQNDIAKTQNDIASAQYVPYLGIESATLVYTNGCIYFTYQLKNHSDSAALNLQTKVEIERFTNSNVTLKYINAVIFKDTTINSSWLASSTDADTESLCKQIMQGSNKYYFVTRYENFINEKFEVKETWSGDPSNPNNRRDYKLTKLPK